MRTMLTLGFLALLAVPAPATDPVNVFDPESVWVEPWYDAGVGNWELTVEINFHGAPNTEYHADVSAVADTARENIDWQDVVAGYGKSAKTDDNGMVRFVLHWYNGPPPAESGWTYRVRVYSVGQGTQLLDTYYGWVDWR